MSHFARLVTGNMKTALVDGGERRAGYVGQALPGVTVRPFDADDRPIREEATPGEIRIIGRSSTTYKLTLNYSM